MTGFKVFAFSSTFWGLIRCCCGVGQFQEADPESCRGVFCHGIRRVFQITQQTTYKDMSCFSTMPKNTSNSQLDIVCFFGFLAATIHLIWICTFHHIYIYVTKTTRRQPSILNGIPMTSNPRRSGTASGCGFGGWSLWPSERPSAASVSYFLGVKKQNQKVILKY